MTRKKLTTYDYLACKGKRQLSNLFVHTVDEAAAAEEAGIDYIVGAHDVPQYEINATLNDVKRSAKLPQIVLCSQDLQFLQLQNMKQLNLLMSILLLV